MARFKDSLNRATDALRQSMGVGFLDAFTRARAAYRLGLGVMFKELFSIPNTVRGDVFLEMRDATTEALLYEDHRKEVQS